MQEHQEDMLHVAATAVANASHGTQQQGPAADCGEPSSEPASTFGVAEDLDLQASVRHLSTYTYPPSAGGGAGRRGQGQSSDHGPEKAKEQSSRRGGGLQRAVDRARSKAEPSHP
eukprot:scaffold27784_cov66-Phaeocystis_antarctica.AAC.5